MTKSGNREAIRFKYWNLINHIMFGQKVNVLILMLDQMADIKVGMESKIPFARYVISLIKAKTSFVGTTSSKHDAFTPSVNERALTPFPDDGGDDEEENDENEGDAQPLMLFLR